MAQKIRFSGYFGPPSKVFAETARQKSKLIVVELTNQRSVVQSSFLWIPECAGPETPSRCPCDKTLTTKGAVRLASGV